MKKMNTKTIIIIIALLAVFAVVTPGLMAIGEDTSVNIKVVGINDEPLRGVEIRTSADGIPIRISDSDGLINNLDSFVYYLVTPSRSSGYGSSQVRFVRGGEYTIKYTDVESTTVIRWGDIPPPDTGTGGDGDTGTIPNGDGTGDGTTNVTDDDGFLSEQPVLKSGLWGTLIGGVLTYVVVVGLIAIGFVPATGTALLLILVGAGALITGLFAALLKTRSMNPDAGIGDTFVELASDTAEVIADGAGKVINYVTEGVTNVYNTVADATKDNMADALAKLLEGDILGAITALITVIIIVAIIGISLVLVVFIAKALIIKKVIDK